MDVRMQARRALEMDLRKALVEGEFELYYQPIQDWDATRFGGFEALLRLEPPTARNVSPPRSSH